MPGSAFIDLSGTEWMVDTVGDELQFAKVALITGRVAQEEAADTAHLREWVSEVGDLITGLKHRESMSSEPLRGTDDGPCTRPLDGWWCTGRAGHDGPCPAWPENAADLPDADLVGPWVQAKAHRSQVVIHDLNAHIQGLIRDGVNEQIARDWNAVADVTLDEPLTDDARRWLTRAGADPDGDPWGLDTLAGKMNRSLINGQVAAELTAISTAVEGDLSGPFVGLLRSESPAATPTSCSPLPGPCACGDPAPHSFIRMSLTDTTVDDAPPVGLNPGQVIYWPSQGIHYTVIATSEGDPVLRPAKIGEL